jgi:hypothetical protein
MGRSLPLLRQQRPPDGLRAIRAVEAVECVVTQKAEELLEAWVGGEAESRPTEEARTALSRIRQR